MTSTPPSRTRPPGLRGTGARIAIFFVAVVALIGLALVAGGIGPWTARPMDPHRAEPPSFPRQSQPVASMSMSDRGNDSEPAALGWGVRLVLMAGAALLLILLLRWLIGKLLALRRDRLETPMLVDRTPGIGGVPAPPPQVAGESGRDFDPRAAADAIVSCWLWVEHAAGDAGVRRREQDTPTEFLERLVGDATVQEADSTNAPAGDAAPADVSGQAAREAARVLLPLYQRARFDLHALTEDAAVRARAAAEQLCRFAGRSRGQ